MLSTNPRFYCNIFYCLLLEDCFTVVVPPVTNVTANETTDRNVTEPVTPITPNVTRNETDRDFLEIRGKTSTETCGYETIIMCYPEQRNFNFQ